MPKARSRVGGYHFPRNNYNTSKPLETPQTFINSPIYVESRMLRNVMGKTSEAKIADRYVNIRKRV